MPDNQRPADRDINIQSTVNVDTANDQTTVRGATVSVGEAEQVNIHNPPAPALPPRLIILTAVLALVEGGLVNVATGQLPASWTPYLWLSWPMLVLVTAASIWMAYRQGRAAEDAVAVASALDARNRARMLDKVESFWIKGVLEQSLYRIARLELGLEQAPEKIDHPWTAIVQQAAASRAVPTGTPTIRLFDDLDGKLLILGAPGSGKTTLLELARDLIDRARNDPKALR